MPASDTGFLQLGQDVVRPPASGSEDCYPAVRNVCLLERGSGLHADLQLSDFEFDLCLLSSFITRD